MSDCSVKNTRISERMIVQSPQKERTDTDDGKTAEIIATDAANKTDFAFGIRVFSAASAGNMKSAPLDDNRRWDLRRGKDGPDSCRMTGKPEVTELLPVCQLYMLDQHTSA